MLDAPARVESWTVPASGPSSTSRVKGTGVGYIAVASSRHPPPWISTAMPFSGFNSGIEIVPRCPGSNPGKVAAESLATETTTPKLAWFSTSKLKATGDAVRSVVGVVVGNGVIATVADGAGVGGCVDGLGVGLQAEIAIRSAASARRIALLASRTVKVARATPATASVPRTRRFRWLFMERSVRRGTSSSTSDRRDLELRSLGEALVGRLACGNVT